MVTVDSLPRSQEVIPGLENVFEVQSKLESNENSVFSHEEIETWGGVAWKQ